MYMQLISYLKRHRELLFLIAVGILFVLLYSWLYAGQTAQFTSPDETANYFFSSLYAEEGTFRYHEPFNDEANGLIHPRSTTTAGEYIVPTSFLGLPLLYGIIGKIFGIGVIKYLTPIFSVIGVIFFYLLLRRLFTGRIAFTSSLMLFVLPPFVYYASRGMFHNILFIVFVIIGFYFIVRALQSKKLQLLSYSSAGLFIGSALITRTSEFIWLLGIILISAVIYRNRIRRLGLILFIVFIIIIFIPIVFLNVQLYDGLLTFGYSFSDQNASQDTQPVIEGTSSILHKAVSLILPFGINSKTIADSVYQYLFIIFPWFSIPLIIGLVWVSRSIVVSKLVSLFPALVNYRKFSRSIRQYTGLYLIVSLWLILYYGSWKIVEHFDPTEIILGSSYIRYWLPIYIFGLPILSYSLFYISKQFTHRKARTILLVGFISAFFLLSIGKVFQDPLQGVTALRSYNKQNHSLVEKITAHTDENAIIVSGHADKIIFPHRKVIVTLSPYSDDIAQRLRVLQQKGTLYILENPLDDSVDEVNSFLLHQGFHKSQITSFNHLDDQLYEIH